MSIRRYWKLGAVAVSCLAIGAGASVIASAGAATGTSTAQKHSHAQRRGGRLGAGRLLRRAVHGDLVLATKTGFATITFDRGTVQSISGQQLTLKEGRKTATGKTVTITVPANARVRDNRKKATLADVKPGQRAVVIQAPKRTMVIARTARTP